MTKIDKLIEKVKKGKPVLQFMEGEFSYYIVFISGRFSIEKYNLNGWLIGVEPIDEATARFSLT
jgi:hypothetical protein